jgi:hypothetical protein
MQTKKPTGWGTRKECWVNIFSEPDKKNWKQNIFYDFPTNDYYY